MIDRRLLLEWYEPRRGAYPWRSCPDPYHVLVAEFMLQQTQVARVVPAHAAFLERFPSVEVLAEAPLAEVIRAWAGLGYNRRAVALWRTAGYVVTRFGGRIPSHPGELESLPGIGPYTAAAVASQAYGFPAAAVDTNVRRVVGRALLGAEPSEAPAAAVADAASVWLDPKSPGEWNQALMDLGREHCRPAPSCPACPLLPACAAPGPRTAPARPAPARRSPGRPHRTERFEGSFRQVRGKVVAALRAGPPVVVGDLALMVGEPVDRVVRAVVALARDGLATADDAALGGDPSGSVALPG
ncbi:MAG TPA: A/G-specific adenine glycosylase [Actinomycetota bacterium]